MFDIQNLLQDGQGFGGRSWVAMAIWVIGLIAGVYFYQGWREANPLRARFFQRTGLGLAIISAVGLVVLALRAFGVPVLSKPIWGYLVFLATLGYLAWAAYFLTQRLPALVATSRDAARRQPTQRAGARSYGGGGKQAQAGARTYAAANAKQAGARTYTADGPADGQPAAPARPVATTNRRGARRDKKRKGR
ncbi:MAG: hypothetical protein H0X37_08050 [Herpetosiphonaceae bacterium]|nr:hypothetical protein [Herpetosiphonaceae bacterium]